jgi:hypothetical protein
LANPKIIGAQRDFSSGEVDVSVKRSDEMAAMKAGARQMSNWRILNSKKPTNRPGRSALFEERGRVEEVLMSPGQKFYLVFGDGYLHVYNLAGVQVFQSTNIAGGGAVLPWGPGKYGGITYAIYQDSIYIAYAGNIPQILTWDGVSQISAWVQSNWNEAITVSGQKLTPFYRISPSNITLQPGGQSGNVSIQFSAPVLQNGMVGTRLSWCGQQMTITAVFNSTSGTAVVQSLLPGSEILPFSSTVVGTFNVGDEVIGSISGAKGIVTAVNGGANTITVQLIPPNLSFLSTDTVVGPHGGLPMSAGATATSPGAVSLWNDEVMNQYRGYPSSVSFDQGRLIFSNFPAVPSGIAWSAIGVMTDFSVDPTLATTSPSAAIFEIAPGKSQVQYVVAGMESSEFVFCDNAIYFIPISTSNPLVPGSVAFIELSANGCMPNVQPRRTEQTIIYMRPSGVGVGAVQAPGAYNRPYIIDNISDLHGHLFKSRTPIAIAIPTESPQFEETYIYIALDDGSLVVGKYSMKSGLIEPGPDGKPSVGWTPWVSVGTTTWISALQSSVIMTSIYTIVGAGPVGLVDQVDDTQYLDGAVSVNNLPTALAAPAGKGPLWMWAGGSVTLMDQGTRQMGIYQVDANGNLIPQGIGGENLASAQLVAGQPWTATLEPFVPDADPGRSIGQRMFKRRVSRMAVYVSNSTGFLMARLFSGPLTRTSPALGTIMNTYRVTTYNQDDDATQPPPLREEAQRWRPLGRSYDARVAIIKDTPGPLLVHEIGIEATI